MKQCRQTRVNHKSVSSQQVGNATRKLNPSDISVPPGYKVEVYAYELDTPIGMVFTENGEILIADAGILSGNPMVIRLKDNAVEMVADGFNIPITGINYLNGNIYVSHAGKITIVKPDGTKQDILTDLPSHGDHSNNQVVFGMDNKMYFGQGTATNSGVVGLDNTWSLKYPDLHDYPGSNIILRGTNFKTTNFQGEVNSIVQTGAFSPFGVTTKPKDIKYETVKASGSILRANLDGTDLELVAWGFRNPFQLKFDRYNQLFVSNNGADIRGSRPIANSPDEFQIVIRDVWYGWPDYTGGLPVTLPQFKPEDLPQPDFLLASHPMQPPQPFAVFTPHSAVTGFDFNYNPNFGPYGDAYIALYGSETPVKPGGNPDPGVGHKVSKIDMNTGEITDFAINKSGVTASATGGGGLEKPTDVVFGPDGAMYVLDFGAETPDAGLLQNTGVIWKISKV